MSREATVTISLRIKKDNLNYSHSQQFRADINGSTASSGGPTPGSLLVPVDGVTVDLSELVSPGLIEMQNLDPDNYVEWGLMVSGVFRPLGELRGGTPAEGAIFRLSRNLGEEEAVPGTGTSTPTNVLYLRANTAPCQVIVNIFED